MHTLQFTVQIPKDCTKPIGVIYNNDDGTALVIMANSLEEATELIPAEHFLKTL